MSKTLRRAGMIALALVATVGLTGCYSKPESGEMGVVRNGGPLDDHKIRQVVLNGQGTTWVGLFSNTHYYPVSSQQRFFTLATCFENDIAHRCDNADGLAISVPTADGVEVSLSGTFYINTVFDSSPAGISAIKAFDTQFGTRTFNGKYPYDHDQGWSDFLGAVVEPVIKNNLREVISGVTCADLKSSCALVQNQGNAVKTSDLVAKDNKGNVQRIQDQINAGLVADLTRTLGGTKYFDNIRFNLSGVDLPPKIQAAIDTAQAAFANVSQAQARVKSAELDAKANEERQAGYLKCPTCARIDALKALPKGLQALGGNIALGITK